MNIAPSTVLANIIATQDSTVLDKLAQEAEDKKQREATREAIGRTLADEANMFLEMDFYIREKLKANSVRWSLYRAANEFKEVINDNYYLTEEQFKMFEPDLQDLISARVANIKTVEEGQRRDVARIILRVIYADDFKRFVDDYLAKLPSLDI